VFAVACCAGPPLPAAGPQLQRVSPCAVEPGQVSILEVAGSNLEKPTGLWTSFPAETKVLPDGRFQVQVDSQLAPQVGAVRVITNDGISNLRLVLVDRLPTGVIAGSDQSLAIGEAVEGHVDNESVRSFQLDVEKGMVVTLDLWARRLGSRLDPLLEVFDSDGREVAASDDEPGLDGDCRLSFEAPGRGPYVVRLRDATFSGGSEAFFRLRVGSFGVQGTLYPPALRRGSRARLTPVTGEPLSSDLAIIPADFPGRVHWLNVSGSLAIHSLRVTDRKEHAETMPASSSGETEFAIGDGISGWFSRPGEIDHYQFVIEEPRDVSFHAQTRALHSSALLRISVINDKQEIVARAGPDKTLQQKLTVRITQPGTYQLVVEELLQRSGRRFFYRVTSDEKKPSFQLGIQGDAFNASEDRLLVVKVIAARDGYDGEIVLRLDGVEGDLSLENEVIAAGAKETELKIHLPADWDAGTIHQVGIIGRGEAEQFETLAEQDALKFPRGNLGVFDGFVSDEQTAVTNFAEYDIELPAAGRYQLRLKYAAMASRPAILKINGEPVKNDAMKNVTGGWDLGSQQWHREGTFDFRAGKNVIRIERDGTVSHLSLLRVTRELEGQPLPGSLVQRATCRNWLRAELNEMPFPPEDLVESVVVGIGGKKD
jgi:hypothetical protein